MPPSALEIRRTAPEWEGPLAAFFAALREGGDEGFFHPHPLTAEQAGVVSRYAGRDLFYLLVDGREVLGYGMLRGWDEGYEVPSLGIALHPDARGRGLARPFMEFLHAAARQRGAPRVRLKVYRANARALRLYQGLGYAFADDAADEPVGLLEL